MMASRSRKSTDTTSDDAAPVATSASGDDAVSAVSDDDEGPVASEDGVATDDDAASASTDDPSDEEASAPAADADPADEDAAPVATDDSGDDAAPVATDDDDEGPVASEDGVATDDDAASASTDDGADEVAPAAVPDADPADEDAAPVATDDDAVSGLTDDDADDAAPAGDDSSDEDAVLATGDDPDDLAAATPSELAAEIVQLRAKTDALQRQLDVSTKQKQKQKSKRVHRPARYWGSIVCVVVGALLLPLSVIGRWTSTTLLDTETYVATVTPLAEDEDIQEAVSFRVSQVLVEAIDIEELVSGDLPPAAGFIAGPIESAAQSLIDDVVQEVVSTDAFTRFWADANRIGHEGVVAILTGEGTDRIDAADGKVVLKVGPLVQNVIQRLDEILGTDLADSIPDEQLDGEFVLVDSDDLGSLQGAIRLFDDLSVLLPILVIALFAASVYLSKPRRIGFRNVGYAIVTPMVIFLLLYTWARGQYIDGLPDDTHNPDAAAAAFDITTRLVTRDLWVVLVMGVVILFVAWLIGPTGWAGRTRAWWKTLMSQAGERSADSEIGAVPKWVAGNERNLLVTVFVVGLATLLLWTLPTGSVVLVVTVIAVLVMAVIHVLAEIGRKATDDVEAETAAGDAVSPLAEDQTT
jgi:hypothetical protein